MPKEFEQCVKNGGKVRTVTGPSKKHKLKEGEYVKYCILKGKTYRGHVQKSSTKKAYSNA